MPTSGRNPDELRAELQAHGWTLEERVKAGHWTLVATRGDEYFATSGGDPLVNLHAVYRYAACDARR